MLLSLSYYLSIYYLSILSIIIKEITWNKLILKYILNKIYNSKIYTIERYLPIFISHTIDCKCYRSLHTTELSHTQCTIHTPDLLQSSLI